MTYFPGSPSPVTESVVIGDSFYFPLAIHMHAVAKSRSLEVKSADLEARRVNLGVK